MSDLSVGSFNGLSWDTSVPGLQLNGHTGIDDGAPLRTADVNRAMDSGEWAGIDFAAGRDVTLDYILLGESPAGYLALVETFRTAFLPQLGVGAVPLPLTWGTGADARQINVKCRDRKVPYQAPYRTSGTASVLFHANDPRIYSATANTVDTGMAQQTSSFVFPVTFPIQFGTQTQGAVIATNAGTVPAPCVITVQGPVTNPAIENVTTQQTLTFLVTLDATDVLVIDTNAKTALLNGVSRRSALDPSSAWWSLVPGDNTVQFRGQTFQASALAEIAWHDAWL